jgi:hypothetical protein
MSAAERFSSEIAKLGAPVGSGLSRHGTKTVLRQTAAKQSSVSSVAFSSGDSAAAMLLKSGPSGGESVNDTNSQPLSGLRITKTDTKQHFLDGGSVMFVEKTDEVMTAKKEDPLTSGMHSSTDYKQEKGEEQGKEEKDEKSSSKLSHSDAKTSGRFGHNYVVLDPRASSTADSTQGLGATLFERYHNMHASSDLQQDGSNDVLSPTQPPQAPFALSLGADSKDRPAVSPLGTGSKRTTSHREAFKVSATASIPQPVVAPSNSYK